jgi:acyl-CoA oxidase
MILFQMHAYLLFFLSTAVQGRNGIDNGWIQFTHVRSPRMQMLMKYTQVSADGEVKEPPLEQLAYGALILGRITMIVGE